MQDDKWGPWQYHDGSGVPDSVQGRLVQLEDDEGTFWEGIAGSQGGESWDDHYKGLVSMVVRYRVRKNRTASRTGCSNSLSSRSTASQTRWNRSQKACR